MVADGVHNAERRALILALWPLPRAEQSGITDAISIRDGKQRRPLSLSLALVSASKKY